MLRLFDVPVAKEDARSLVATLLADDHPHSAEAAATIAHGLELGASLVALTPEERDAILAALEDPPEGLVELRGVLMRDFEQRAS